MYLWRIDLLKQDLAAGPLPEREAFRYILAYLLLVAVCAELTRLIPEPLDTWRGITSSLVLVSVAVGTYAVYRANGGAAGHEFANRFFSLAFVFSVRFTLAAGAAVLLVGVWWAVNGVDVEHVRWLDALTLVLLVIPYYWRLAGHMRHVAQRRMDGHFT